VLLGVAATVPLANNLPRTESSAAIMAMTRPRSGEKAPLKGRVMIRAGKYRYR